MVELLLKEVSSGIDELQSKMKTMSNEAEMVTKSDVNAIETLCLDTKTQIEELNLPDPDILATKHDISGVDDSIKAVQEQIEVNNELTAQAFEARKVEHGGLATKIDDVKGVIGDLRDELIGKLDGSEEGLVELAKVLGDHHDGMKAYATATSVAELSDLVNKEFERHMDHHNASRQLNEDGYTTLLAKHEEISGDLRSRIEDKFNDLITRYDDAQISNESKLRSLDERDRGHLDAMNHTKAIVEDTKILLDTLGTSVTEACDQLSDDSKTVFSRVEDIHAKLGELGSTNASEHVLTREEVAKTLATALRLEGSLNEHQPSLMKTLQRILGLVGQHFEHSQQQSENMSRVTEEIKSGINAVPESIPPLLPPPAAPSEPLVREIPVHQPYDDTQVHDKLNNLISHATVAKEAFAKMETHHRNTEESLAGMEKLEKIHEQVMATAGEISAMVATQSRLMNEHHESRSAEAAEVAIALEKRRAQKEKVEADIATLMQEKEALMASMAALKREQQELHTQTKRLTRDVAKLETALSIRQEEMKDMNARAEGLERRILEGVMNQARSVKISRPSRQPKMTAEERDRAMSLKRVPSVASNATTKTSIKDAPSSITHAVGMALKKRAPLTSSPNSTVSSRHSGIERRILSTSHVQGNKRETMNRALTLAPVVNTGIVSLKRCHSVKSNAGRKTSWNPADLTGMDKENQSLEEQAEDEQSDAGTERRTSFGGTSVIYTDTNSSMMYGTGSTLSMSGRRTASYGSSVGGTIDGVLGGQTESIAEEDEDGTAVEDPEGQHHDQDKLEAQQQDDEHKAIMALLESAPAGVVQDTALVLAPVEQPESVHTQTHVGEEEVQTEWLDGISDLQPPPRLIMHREEIGNANKWNQPSDSGLGTEPPTADGERMNMGEAMEYFDMSRREGQQHQHQQQQQAGEAGVVP